MESPIREWPTPSEDFPEDFKAERSPAPAKRRTPPAAVKPVETGIRGVEWLSDAVELLRADRDLHAFRLDGIDVEVLWHWLPEHSATLLAVAHGPLGPRPLLIEVADGVRVEITDCRVVLDA